MDEALKQLLAQGRDHFQKRQYGQAERYLKQVVEQSQSFPDVYNMLGIIHHDAGRFDQAEKALEIALRLNPAYTEAALNLAVIYNDLGKYQEAKKVYQQALSRQRGAPGQLDPFVRGKIANMYAEIGDVFASSGLWAQATTEYRRALDLCPEFADIRLRLAITYRDAGQVPQAIAELEQVIQRNPSYFPGRIHYGISLYSAGRREEAVKVWEEVLAEDPGNKSAVMYLQLVRDGGKSEQGGP
jgi:tetratricopeptide (TPR) repeat protein